MDLAERVAVSLGVDEVAELTGGHQSRVFRVARNDGSSAVAKVLDTSMTDRSELDARLDVTAALAELDPRVCQPLLIGEQRVAVLSSAGGEEFYITCHEFAAGRTLDPSRPTDAERMGAALSQLHVSMGQVPPSPLPLVRALRAIPPGDAHAGGPHQILHGDFSASNLREVNGAIRIFDLDDSGYGPPAFDVANALYMVLFDASVHGTTGAYETFRQHFVDGYVSASGPDLSEESVDRFVDLRVAALGKWLDDLETAPVGIRTSSAAWQATLRSFVSAYRATSR